MIDFVWFVKIQQVAIRGTPDFLICCAGRFIAIELKRNEKEKPTPMQVYNLKKIQDAGGYSFVITPNDWPNVLNFIRSISLSIA